MIRLLHIQTSRCFRESQRCRDRFHIRGPLGFFSIDVFSIETSSVRPASKPEGQIPESLGRYFLHLFSHSVPSCALKEKVSHCFWCSSTVALLRIYGIDAC